jgi:hypothetical protein
MTGTDPHPDPLAPEDRTAHVEYETLTGEVLTDTVELPELVETADDAAVYLHGYFAGLLAARATACLEPLAGDDDTPGLHPG